MRRTSVNVFHRLTGRLLLREARWGASFWSRLRGLMFRARLRPGEALIMAWAGDSIANTSIHMFFVPFAIATVWINAAGRVVDKVEAKPWRPFYAARAPARYVLETAPEFLEQVQIGDELVFEDSAPVDAAPARR